MTQQIEVPDGSSPPPAPRSQGADTTTVITVGLTPPLLGGGLVLAYLGIRGRGAAAVAQGAATGVGEGAAKAAETAAGLAGTAAATATGALQTAGGSAGRAMRSARQTAVQTAGRVGQTVGDASSAAAAATTSRISALPEVVRDKPALGLGLGLGVGALVAFAIPPTQRERALLGPAGETITEQLRTGAQETVQKVQLVAEEAGSTIRQSATEVGLVPVSESETNSAGGG